ncbi:MAG: O-antigen ligase family protein [Syntrophaceae bacterium]|nr:O-antigen ligase family protein [Syntrophaceae bacterium]
MPLSLLAFSALGFLFRPGFFLGVVFQAYQYESVYSIKFAGSVSLVLFVLFTVVIAIFSRVKIVWLLPEKLLALFTITYCIAAFYSPDPGKGLELGARFISVCLSYYIIGRLLTLHRRYKEWWIFDFGIAVTFLSLTFGYLGYHDVQSDNQLYIGTGTSVGFSQVLDVSLGFWIFFLLVPLGKKSWLKKSAIAVIAAVLLFIVVANSRRGTVISLALSVCCILALQPIFKHDMRNYIRSFGILFSTVCVVFILLHIGLSASGDDLISRGVSRLTMNISGEELTLDQSGAERWLKLSEGWELFLNAPFFGHGLGSYDFFTGEGYPHNVIVELLSEAGFPIAILFIILIVMYAKMGIILLIRTDFSPIVTIIVGLFIMSFVHQQFSFMLWMAKPNFLFMGTIASLFQDPRLWMPRTH